MLIEDAAERRVADDEIDQRRLKMATTDEVRDGLEGVLAFATETDSLSNA